MAAECPLIFPRIACQAEGVEFDWRQRYLILLYVYGFLSAIGAVCAVSNYVKKGLLNRRRPPASSEC